MRARHAALVTVRARYVSDGATSLPHGLHQPGGPRPTPSSCGAHSAWLSASQTYKRGSAPPPRSGVHKRRLTLLVEAVEVVAVHQPDEFARIARVGGVARVLNRLRKGPRIIGHRQRGRVPMVAEEELAVIVNRLFQRQVRAERGLNDDVATVRRV